MTTKNTKICGNCGATPTVARERCNACYTHLKRKGGERPVPGQAALAAPTPGEQMKRRDAMKAEARAHGFELTRHYSDAQLDAAIAQGVTAEQLCSGLNPGGTVERKAVKAHAAATAPVMPAPKPAIKPVAPAPRVEEVKLDLAPKKRERKAPPKLHDPRPPKQRIRRAPQNAPEPVMGLLAEYKRRELGAAPAEPQVKTWHLIETPRGMFVPHADAAIAKRLVAGGNYKDRGTVQALDYHGATQLAMAKEAEVFPTLDARMKRGLA